MAGLRSFFEARPHLVGPGHAVAFQRSSELCLGQLAVVVGVGLVETSRALFGGHRLVRRGRGRDGGGLGCLLADGLRERRHGENSGERRSKGEFLG